MVTFWDCSDYFNFIFTYGFILSTAISKTNMTTPSKLTFYGSWVFGLKGKNYTRENKIAVFAHITMGLLVKHNPMWISRGLKRCM